MERATEVVINALRAAPTKRESEFGLEYDSEELEDLAARLERGELVLAPRTTKED